VTGTAAAGGGGSSRAACWCSPWELYAADASKEEAVAAEREQGLSAEQVGHAGQCVGARFCSCVWCGPVVQCVRRAASNQPPQPARSTHADSFAHRSSTQHTLCPHAIAH
jgi:hypothetical protein